MLQFITPQMECFHEFFLLFSAVGMDPADAALARVTTVRKLPHRSPEEAGGTGKKKYEKSSVKYDPMIAFIA